MIKDDEKALWKEIWKVKTSGEHPYFREIAKRLGINENRAYYIVSKWERKGLTNSGINPLAGWIEEGITEMSLNDI